jgi:iron(III) transport system substrate-binding protein
MRRIKEINIGLLAVLMALGFSGFVQANSLEDLVAGAKKEGALELYGPSTLTSQGADTLSAAFNKKYGLNAKVTLHNSLNMTRDVGKLVGMAATGVPPEWDTMIVTDAHYATLWLRKLIEPYDYKSAGVDPQVIHYDNGSITFANQIVLPAYNKKTMPAKDVPTKWEDLLDPKWKDGKLGVSTATHHFARLAVGAWGEEKTTKFVNDIANQKPILGRLAELYNRLLLGEISIAVTLTDSNINEAKKTGAPVVFADAIQPVIAPAYQSGVIKGAKNPSTGHLFSIFLTSNEAQAIWEKYNGQTSAFIPGTNAYKFLHGKQALFMDQKQAKTVDKLARQYGKMLGFNR